VATVPQEGLTVSPDGREASLEMKRIAVTDQPKWPAYDAPFTPAVMSFRVVWKATEDKIAIDDKERQFRFIGFRAVAQAEASVEVPSLNFSWKSDPIDTSHAAFAVIGNEENGRYYRL
jgi:hypothetical protein